MTAAPFATSAAWADLRRRWMGYWFTPEAPTNLAVCRILFLGGVLIMAWPSATSDFGDVSEVFWQPIWLFRDSGPPSALTIEAAETAWVAALALGCLGIATRFSTLASFALGAYVLGVPQNFGKIHHTHSAVVIVLGILACSRCGDALSFDASRRDQGSRGPLAASGEYRWPVRAVWLALASIFLAAGIAKLRESGLDWATSDHFSWVLVQAHYRVSNADPLTMVGLDLASSGAVVRAMASASLATELCYPLALVFQPVRRVVVPMAVMSLIAIRVLMGPTFEPLILAHVFWVPWPTVGRGIRRFIDAGRPRRRLGPADHLPTGAPT